MHHREQRCFYSKDLDMGRLLVPEIYLYTSIRLAEKKRISNPKQLNTRMLFLDFPMMVL